MIFVNTGAWVALEDKRDAHTGIHAKPVFERHSMSE